MCVRASAAVLRRPCRVRRGSHRVVLSGPAGVELHGSLAQTGLFTALTWAG